MAGKKKQKIFKLNMPFEQALKVALNTPLPKENKKNISTSTTTLGSLKINKGH